MVYKSCKICKSDLKPFIGLKEIVRCTNCGLVFYSKSLDQETVAEIYNNLYNNDIDISYMAHKNNQQLISKGIQPKLGYNKTQILKRILKSRRSNIAEIGAGVGIVGKYLTDIHINYTGIEIEQSVAIVAQKMGINIEAGSFQKLKKYPTAFDALVAFEVIEHIDDLGLCLKLINQSLKQDGLFGFTVPNLDKRKNYGAETDKLYQPNPPIHVNFFTVDNISRILKRYGFDIIFLKKRPFPDLNLKKINTYKQFAKVLTGKFEGSTILCIAKKE